MTANTVDFKTAFEAMPGSFVILQPNPPQYTILAISDELLHITGRKRQDAVGKSLFELYAENHEAITATGLSNLRISLQNVVKYKKPNQLPVVRYDFVNAEGIFEERYWLAKNKPVLDIGGEILYIIHSSNEVTDQIKVERKQDGSVTGVLTVATDVTTQMPTKQQSVESGDRYRTLIEEAPVATALYMGKEMRIQYVNNIMMGYWGKDASVVGKTLREALPELEKQSFPDLLDKVYATGEQYTGVKEKADLLIGGKLQSFYFNFTYKPLRDKEGSIYGIHHMAIDVTKEVLAQKKIEESEQQLRSLIESAPFPIGVYTGKEMRIRFTNQAILDAWGKGNDVIGRLFAEVLPELGDQKIFEQLDEVFTTGTPFHAKNQRVDLVVDGKLQPYYFNYSYTPLYDTLGNVYGVMNTAADVTDLNLANLKVEESEKNLRNIILQAPVAMCILRGPEHIVEIANDRMFELWGRKSEELLNKSIFEGLPEATAQGFEQLLDSVFTTGKTFSAYGLPVTLPRQSKTETIYINFVYEALRAGDGTISGVMAVATDVTDQVVASKKIEEAEERARLAVESAELGTYEVNLLTNEVADSPRMAAIFDVDTTPDRNRYITAIHPEDLELRDDAYKKAYESSILDYQARVVHKDGSLHWIRVKGKILYNNEKVPVRLLGVIQDITEQKEFSEALRKKVEERTRELAQANEHLASINKELEQFTYAASHDMQEPLRKVQTFSAFLLNNHTAQLDDKGKNFLSKIVSSVNRMKTIIDDLLNYSHQTREAQAFVPTDLNKIIEHIEADMELVIQQKEAVILKDTLPQILAVPAQINQLFFNLFSNALKFSKPGVPVKIEIRSSSPLSEELSVKGLDPLQSYVKISFSDNGIGFEQEYAEQIFSLFKRLHGRNEFEGTGIGLGLCKKIVQNHNGAIWAESEPDKGAFFYILLPQIAS